jgi:hypothetical protein
MRNSLLVLFAIVLSLAVLSGCKRSANQSAVESSTIPSSPEPTPRNEFERNLQYIRRAHFKYVWLFSRPDGAALDKADGEFLRLNTPRAVDRIRADEAGHSFLVGSNFDIDPANMEALRKRFKVEDYSGK